MAPKAKNQDTFTQAGDMYSVAKPFMLQENQMASMSQ